MRQPLKYVEDVLYLSHPKSGVSSDYARGAIVGLVSGLEACGKTWEECLHMIKMSWKDEYRKKCLPSTWKDHIFPK